MSKGKIIVAMSGGVDSAVTAGLLMEDGYEVIGVNLRTWEYEAPACDTTKNLAVLQRIFEMLGTLVFP